MAAARSKKEISKERAPKEESLSGEPRAGDFKRHLEEIAEILEWFDSQSELDVEEALEKVKKAAALIAAGRKRLTEIENEFREIKKEAEE